MPSYQMMSADDYWGEPGVRTYLNCVVDSVVVVVVVVAVAVVVVAAAACYPVGVAAY